MHEFDGEDDVDHRGLGNGSDGARHCERTKQSSYAAPSWIASSLAPRNDASKTESRRPFRRAPAAAGAGRRAATLRVGPGEPKSPPASSAPKSPPPRRRTAPPARRASQFATEPLQHDFGRIAVLAGLILPFARLQRAFDENLRAFFEILLGDPAQILIEDDDAVPFGLFLALTGGLVLPRFRVASRRFATGRPSWVRRISGSAPRLPIKITLLTLPAMKLLRSFPISPMFAFQPSAGPARSRAIGARWPLSTRLRVAAACPRICSYFVLNSSARALAKCEVASTSRRPFPSWRKWCAVVFGQHLLAGKSGSYWAGGGGRKQI